MKRREFCLAAGMFGAAAVLSLGSLNSVQAQPPLRIVPMSRITPDEKKLMDALIPDKPFATPKKKRKLLIYDVNASYGGHGAIPYANYVLMEAGKKTGAFEAIRTEDVETFRWNNLKQYDAIFINNIVGAPFNDKELFDNISRFVREGGGLMGMHGTTAAFLNWGGKYEDLFPEFGQMIGGRNAHHRTQNEEIHVRVDEPEHPLTKMFPADGFFWVDEYFRFPTIYSRDKLRVLLSIDVKKSNLVHGKPFRQERADDDYGVAWIQKYGKGRVFYSSLAHSKKALFDPALVKFYIAATQYILGDYDVPDEPSNAAKAAK